MTRASNQVAVVTGGSRGTGRGIAIALGAAGFTVYVTGRTTRSGDSPLPGTIHETAEAITGAGGTAIAVPVDHRDDDQVRALFGQVRADSGRLDVLVNNAALIHDELLAPVPFWEKPLAASVDLLDVGLRSSLVATYHAAPLLVDTRAALVVFTSAAGAVHYVYGPAYGAHKAGMDKFAADMAVDFRPFGVGVVSIWMGAVLTERLRAMVEREPERLGHVRAIAETPEFTGRIIAALHDDPGMLELSGRTLIGAELAMTYGIADADGRQPPSSRRLMGVAPADYRGRIER